MPIQTENNPAFARIPPWVMTKLRPKAIETIQAVYDWVETECIPAEAVMKEQLAKDRWKTPALMHELRKKAKAKGLFNLFLPNHFKESPGLTNLEYSCCAEIMGRNYWAAQTMNCHAPETGNIELLAKYCTPEQKKKWLVPLMEGEMSSAYSMTEPDRASSDATQIGCSMRKEGNELVINGRKLYGNASWNDEMGIFILMGCTDPTNPSPWKRHTTVIVPSRSKGLTMKRNLTIMGYDWAPEGHGEYVYENVRVPLENIILGEGRAFEIAQGRLGPGRIHHCMRLIGQTERAYELALIRCIDPKKMPRGKHIGDFDSNIERIASMRLEIDAMRLVVLNAADVMDTHGNKAGRYAIAQSKILVPKVAAEIIDECMQLYGGQGLTQHTPLPEMWTYARFVRVADGPDAAHRHQVGRDQMKTAKSFEVRHREYMRRSKELARQYGTEDKSMDEDML
ncbi:acyl-CoA dehydrogenase family member 11 [Aulographum hederae CBS 113979]|uniref:Acyl-CoA dehydrogenase family member 11 n=1 Tax=Aulographum hederae CBS 113979 TaxID=1176131 RepID=A0A6G1HB15_9PEZI|nr:acyl-CoA dehydrogenase family member 11 [Aulographum hederae CBS 113979]